MAFISFLKELDQSLLLFLNGLHNEFWDMVMLMFTRKEIWLPLYFALGLLILKKYRMKFILIFGIVILAVVFSDQLSVLVKESVKRLRPVHDPEIGDLVHNVFRKGGLHGFFSSHASNTIAVAFLTSKLFNNKLYTITVFCWALAVSYSRIYLGVHYPFDVLVGIGWGIFTGYVFYKIALFAEQKVARFSSPKIQGTSLTPAEAMSFVIVFVVSVATMMLVIWRLQYYNFM